MPRNHCVLARRYTLDREAAVFRCHCKEWMLGYSNVRLHPRMLIALHRNQNFSARKFVRQRRRAVRLRLVPIGIVLWREVNVVCRRITVGDCDWLIHHYTENVRLVMAAV